MNDPTPSQPAAGIRIRVVHLLVLSAFTTAQPIYDLLTRHPEFLPAHQSEPVDILLLTLMLSLLLPGAAALVVRGLSVFHLRLGAGTYLGLLGLLTAGLALQALKRLTVPAEAALVLSLLSGAGFVFVYGRFSPDRSLSGTDRWGVHGYLIHSCSCPLSGTGIGTGPTVVEQNVLDAGHAILQVLDLASHFMNFEPEHAPRSDLNYEQNGPNSNDCDQFRVHTDTCSGVWTRTGAIFLSRIF